MRENLLSISKFVCRQTACRQLKPFFKPVKFYIVKLPCSCTTVTKWKYSCGQVSFSFLQNWIVYFYICSRRVSERKRIHRCLRFWQFHAGSFDRLREKSINIKIKKKKNIRLSSTAATKWNIAAIRIQFSVIRKWFVQRPIPNLNAARSFVFVLKSRFCKWRSLIGLHFCNAFFQKDKIFSCGRVGVVFLLYHSWPAKSVNRYYFFVEVDEASIDISGFPERTVCSSVIRNFTIGQRDGSENVASKTNLRSIGLYRDYSSSLTLSNVGERCRSWIFKKNIQV